MKINPAVTLDSTQVRKRQRVMQQIETMRADLATLEYFIANADAETLKGDCWTDTVQGAENAVKRALHFATHDGQARMGWTNGKG